MAKIQHLKNILEKEGIEYTKKLLSDTIYIAEKLDGISFNFKKNSNGTFEFYKKSLSKPLGILDRVIISLYEQPISLFENLSQKIKQLIPPDFLFTFEYFPNNKPINLKYDIIPKNNLVLTNAINWNDHTMFLDLKAWANLFGTDWLEFVNREYSAPEEKVKLRSLSEDNINGILGMIDGLGIQDEIFSMFPQPDENNKGMLFSDGGKIIEGFVFLTKNHKYPFVKLVTNEYYEKYIQNRAEKIESRKSQDLVNLVIIDFVNFYTMGQNSNFVQNLIIPEKDELMFSQQIVEETYLHIMMELFNYYMKNNYTRWDGVVFPKPQFAISDYFNLNARLITNKETLKYFEFSDNYKDILKILLGFFRKSRIRATEDGVINNKNEKIVLGLMSVIQNRSKELLYKKDLLDMSKPEPKKEVELETKVNILENEVLASTEFFLELMSTQYGEDITLEDLAPLSTINQAAVGNSMGGYNQGTSPVNIFPGRFQPFHNGHLKAIKKMYDVNKKPTVIVVISKDDKEHTYNQELHSSIFKDLIKNHEFIKDIVFAKKGWIKDIVNSLRPKYEPVLWGFGDDRKENYTSQINNWSKNFGADIKPYHIDRNDDKISSTDIKDKIEKGENLTDYLPKEVIKHIETIKKLIKK